MADTPSKSHGRLTISASMKPRDLMAEPPRVKQAWRAKIITLFPEAFPGVLQLSLTGKALDMGLWALDTIDLRPFGEGRHRNVDDTPAGGGAGMVLKPTAPHAAEISSIDFVAGKSSTTDAPVHENTGGSPQTCFSTVDLPEPEGPTTRPTFHGCSSYGKSICHDSEHLSSTGQSNMAATCFARAVVDVAVSM